MKRKLVVFLLSFIVLLAVLIKIPLNRFIPEQTNDVLVSIIEPVSIWSGQGYFQIRGEPDVWRFDYQLCAAFSWCVQLQTGANQFESRVSPNGSGIKLSSLSFNGDNEMLRGMVSQNMASFELTASADEVLVPNLACPGKGIEVKNGVARASKINVLGTLLNDMNASVALNNKNELSLITTGSIEGKLNISSTVYSGRFKLLNAPESLTEILPPQQITSGWAVNGKLPCKS